jgi:CheY-like chemotaxis protein
MEKREQLEGFGEATPTAVPAASAKQWRVLLVEDNREIAEILNVVLESLGCITRVANDGPSAIAAAEGFEADLVLLDIGLPGMDGYEVARRLRATSTMRIVAMTGHGQPSDVQTSIEVGIDEYIVKPFGVQTIREMFALLERSTVGK